MSVKDFDVSDAARNLRDRNSAENKKLKARRERARLLGKQIADNMGKTDKSLDKVVGFGSVFEIWRDFRIDSDIDLGIIGGDIRLLEKTVTENEFKIDLVELLDQPQRFRDLVLKNGEVLYEK